MCTAADRGSISHRRDYTRAPMTDDVRLRRLSLFQTDAKACTSCHEPDLLYVHEQHGHARPMLQASPTGALGILVVGEAPNKDDTYNPTKGHLTYDADTDRPGSSCVSY